MDERTISGTFDVRLTPALPPDGPVGRLTLDKTFHGDLTGTSQGEMLAVKGNVEGSAGYVAMETFTGTLEGRKGAFSLQHTGTMDRGTPSLSVTVVPDSGTGELTGLAGTMDIDPSGGVHRYTFRYRLP